jgi:hypothetical protein
MTTLYESILGIKCNEYCLNACILSSPCNTLLKMKLALICQSHELSTSDMYDICSSISLRVDENISQQSTPQTLHISTEHGASTLVLASFNFESFYSITIDPLLLPKFANLNEECKRYPDSILQLYNVQYPYFYSECKCISLIGALHSIGEPAIFASLLMLTICSRFQILK